MKTNLTLHSEDRNLFGVPVRQQTKDEFLCLTDLQVAYNKMQFDKGWSFRTIDDISRLSSFQERVYFLLLEQNFVIPQISGFMETIKERGFSKYMKELGVWKTTGKGENRQVFCNPYLWVLIALEMNPEIYAKVIKWLTDGLVFSRVEAGNNYPMLTEKLSTLPDFNSRERFDYIQISEEMNRRIFGFHKPFIRDTASKEDLKRLNKMQEFLITAISTGLIKTKKEVIETIIKWI